MGGGDLNLKKSWHPSTFRNQERVWKEERKHAEEQQKIDQMRKELEEERQVQELQRMQEAAGGKKRADKLDWMYAAPNASQAPGGDDMEEYLLGKKSVDNLLRSKGEVQKVNDAVNERFSFNNANPVNERDTAAKIREDPLLAIKRREQEAVKAIMNNPLKMRELQESKSGKKKKKDKKEHKHRKEHKSRKHRNSDDREDEESDPYKRRRHESSRSPVQSRYDTPRSPVRSDRYRRRERTPSPTPDRGRRSRRSPSPYSRSSRNRSYSPRDRRISAH
ncbi:Pre-mRNA splicing factor-domain-containing protein [Umbelopsis sp. PMI_123]|nr:Pre-mRNA splicing factor-domain-containing protein [Umbelopsis sp. PMI_123]